MYKSVVKKEFLGSLYLVWLGHKVVPKIYKRSSVFVNWDHFIKVYLSCFLFRLF